MISIEAEREALRALALQRLSLDPRFQRSSAAAVEATLSTASILAWPYYLGETFGESNPLQNSSEQNLFVWGLSQWGGTDVFG